MKVTFEFKQFGSVKPEINVDIIFKYKDNLYFGKYVGEGTNIQCFVGGKLRLKSLSKKNNQSFCIPILEANEITWDEFNSNWE